MREKPRSTPLVYLLCTLIVTIAFGCNLPLLTPGLPPFEPTLTSIPGKVFPTEIVPTKNPPTNAPEPTATSLSGVTMTIENQYYQIEGNTAKELRKQLDKLGVHDQETGKVFDANADWKIKWNFSYQQGNDDCHIDQVEVSLAITYLLPEWKPPADANSILVEKWNNYMKNLIVHEEGHGSLAKEGAQNIYQIIMKMPPAATCDALVEATNAAAQQGLDAIKQGNKAYDRETGHGKTQDAVFP
jgi:predicted secreted Zn-dependent protease